MKKTELSKICGLSRQMIYNLLNDGLSEEDILMKYFNPKEIIKLMEEHESMRDDTIYMEGVNEGYKQCQNEVKDELNKIKRKFIEMDKMNKDLKSIKEITKKVVLDNWKSNNDVFDFKDVNEIYEIVKDY